MSFQIYRNTSLGESLTETIEEMIEEGKINEDVAMAILKQFDLSMSQAISKMVTGKATMKGRITDYRYHENVWSLNLKEVEFKLNQSGSGSMTNATLHECASAKVVVVDSKLAEQGVE